MDWDNFIFDKLNNIIHKGDSVIDVGAHVGKYTEHFLKLVGNTGKVISFELNPRTFNSLNNKFINTPNVTLINAAVSDKSDFEDYYSGCSSYNTNIIGHDINSSKSNHLGNIKSIKLDDFIKEKIDFMKIDVEGAEIKVLKGMEKTINNVKCLLIECHFEEDWKDLKKILINNYHLKCTDFHTGDIISENTEIKPYQILCCS